MLPIPDNGFHYQVPFEVYAQWRLPNSGVFKRALVSPLHAHATFSGASKVETTSRMEIGSCAHTAILEPEICKKVKVYHGKVRRGKAWDEFQAQCGNSPVWTKNQLLTANAIAKAAHSHKLSAPLLKQLRFREVSIIGDVFGVRCKGRPDGVADDFVLDLKTTESCDERQFARTAYALGYHIQAAMYLQLSGRSKYLFLVVESEPPFDVAVFEPEPDWLKDGEDKLHTGVLTWKTSLEEGHWPGRYSEMRSLSIPEWAKELQKAEFD